MPKGEGKGWAKGRTASSDHRIARAAAAHRGRTYRRHVPLELDRRFLYVDGLLSRRTLPLQWTPTMAYVVGLIATDGCLISTRKQLNFKSEDEQLVHTFLNCLGRPLHYRPITGKTGNLHYVAQFSDAAFYRWLQSVGLMPRKSLLLGGIDLPDSCVFACARGLLDGDGSILNYTYAGTGKAAGHRYEALVTRFFSGSERHIDWLRSSLHRVAGVIGSINRPVPDEPGWQLNYAIRESTVLLPLLYPDDGVPKLERKWSTWRDYAQRHGYPATLDEMTREPRSIAR